jgi:hypothetical protein
LVDDRSDEHRPAHQLLSDWRAAERDSDAARKARSVAGLAVEAATAAEQAAEETEVAATAALAASESARNAATSAKKSATQAADAARIMAATAAGDKVRANQSVERAEEAESQARYRYHEAESHGFPKG